MIKFKPYSGSLVQYRMPKLAFKAKAAIGHQRARCNNPRHPYFKYYGAKGIRVEYNTRDFVGWYLVAISRFRGSRPTVGRIDHTKGYRFDNIEIQEWSENSREMCSRLKRDFQKRRVKAIDPKSGRTVGTWSSIVDAARASGVAVVTVSRHMNGRYSKRKVRTGPPLSVLFVAA